LKDIIVFTVKFGSAGRKIGSAGRKTQVRIELV